MPPLTDEELARRTLADKEAFGMLVTRYEAKLARYLERLGLALSEDREDVLQNVFVKAYRNINSFDPALSFSSWVYRIAHNEAMSFFRAKRARPVLAFGEGSEALFTELRDESADASAFAESRLSREEVGKALALLPPRYREALVLRFFEERSYAEMSDILELPIGTVSTLIHRAKRALADLLPHRLSV